MQFLDFIEICSLLVLIKSIRDMRILLLKQLGNNT